MVAGKLIILRGLPCSGKSTWARDLVATNPEAVMRVNRDDLREMLHDGVFIKGSKDNIGTEQTVIQMEHAMVRRGLRAGLTVISDGTNLPNRSVKALVELAEPLGAGWKIKDFTHVPLQTCLDRNMIRNSHRRDAVGGPAQLDGNVIVDLFNRFVSGKSYPLPFEYSPKPELTVEKYTPDLTKPRAVIVDVDGTVARMDGRNPYEFDKVGTDKPIYPVIDLVKTLTKAGYQPVFLSGRKDVCRETTLAWLNEYVMDMQHAELFMRPADDNRPDNEIKLEIFNREIRDRYFVRYAIDDRMQVKQLWYDLGITVLGVGDPSAVF